MENEIITQGLSKYELKYPKIPLPNLKDTMARYLNSIKPISTKSEFEQSVKIVEEFMLKNGPELQKRLFENAKNSKNWVLDIFNEKLPLNSLTFSSNVSFLFNNYKFQNHIEASSHLIFICIIMKNIIMQHKIDQITDLCPSQFYYIFNSCRIPSQSKDYLLTYNFKNNHVIVIYKNSFYKINTSLNFQYLKDQMIKIIMLEDENRINNDEITFDQNFIGVLTTDERKSWVECRDHFKLISKDNASFLEEIQSSMMILCLEDVDSTDLTTKNLSELIWISKGNNRFFDKTIQFIILRDGKVALNYNRKIINGTVANEMIRFIINVKQTYKFLDSEDFGDKYKVLLDKLLDKMLDQKIPITKIADWPRKLTYTLDDFLKQKIINSYQNLKKISIYHDYFTFKDFGKSLISQNYSINTDSFIQMAIQYAYYKAFEKYPVVLQPVQTRRFFLGKTEAVRSLTQQSINFVKSLVDTRIPIDLKQRLGYLAFKNHYKQVIEASKGQGIDRHFEGLRSVLRPNEELPVFFKDKMYDKSAKCDITTIQFTSEYIGLCPYFPPYYGSMSITYFIRDNCFDFSITSKSDNCKLFIDCLSEALKHLKMIFYQPRSRF